MLPNALLTKPGTPYNLSQIKGIALKSHSILIPGSILKKVHNAKFNINKIYKCFFQIWVEDYKTAEANVYCFEKFTPNNKIIKPTNKKINFKKKVKVTYFGAK